VTAYVAILLCQTEALQLTAQTQPLFPILFCQLSYKNFQFHYTVIGWLSDTTGLSTLEQFVESIN
jgi:hypothetical protein